MPAMQNNGGDVLARGAVRATFRPAGENVTKEKWDEMWADFDPEAYRKAENPAVQPGQGVKADSNGGFLPEASETTETA